MRFFTLPLLFSLFFLSSCAETLEEQTIAALEQDRIFEIDLEERHYEFGYINSTENDPDRSDQRRFEELIVLTTNDVLNVRGQLQGISQTIGIRLNYSRSAGLEEFTVNLEGFNSEGPVSFVQAFLGEDFDFTTGDARRRIGLNVGQLSVKRYSNGVRTITLNTRSSGGIPIRGSWTGMLEDAEIEF